MAGLPIMVPAVPCSHSAVASAMAWMATPTASAIAFANALLIICSVAILILTFLLYLTCLISMSTYLRLSFAPDTM